MMKIMLPYRARTVTPEKDEATGQGGFKGQDSTDTPDCGEELAQRIAIARLAAHLALPGFSLHELTGGGFLISRWDRTAHCGDLRAVSAFLRRVADAPGWRPS